MIANAALFRRECLEDYSWDPNYVIGREHVDFYVGHKCQTDWEFGLCPSVLFPHDPGGSDDFLSHRWDNDKYSAAEKYFLKKWGYDSLEPIEHTWIETYDPVYDAFPPHTLLEKARGKIKHEGYLSFLISIYNITYDRFINTVGRWSR